MPIDPTAAELIALTDKLIPDLGFISTKPGPLDETDGGRLQKRIAILTEWQAEWLPRFNGAMASTTIARNEIADLRTAIANTIFIGPEFLSEVFPAKQALEVAALVPGTRLEPLTDVQQEAFDYIKANGPVIGKTICKAVGISSESTFTKHHVPALEKHGVKNKRGAGYYVD